MADTVVSFPDTEQTKVDDAIARKYNYQERIGDPLVQGATKLNPETRDAFIRRMYGEIIVNDITEFLKADIVRQAPETVQKFTPTVTRPPKVL